MKFCLLFLVVNLYLCAGDDDVEQAFKSNEIVSDTIDKAPNEKLEVKYTTSKKEPSLGNEMAPRDVREKPEVNFDAEENAYYTLAMVDPDAPSRKNPTKREWLHWLVVNIPKGGIDKGETITQYVGSGPPKDSGLHRYVFLLYKQPGKIEFNEPNLAKSGPNFSIKKFAEKYNLDHPIAGNFFQAQYDDSV
ncbi:hypothetical protein ILUMI_10619 [Ignelater luminosus]|uniref:Uncharacterized protein n=1 Tax=Ignelater luminosus TaxID=2038154 RepID=A0A8K0D6Q1_IGNLU|nr:hypothetical protein ILUMI_10619 [Ignelater luminosus]